jgi:hypothetical protein
MSMPKIARIFQNLVIAIHETSWLEVQANFCLAEMKVVVPGMEKLSLALLILLF